MAGLGSSCSHVAALLFKLEAAAHFKLNDKTTCMSQFCSLKASRKYVEPTPLSAIDFSRSKKHALPKASKKVITYVSYSCVDPTVGKNAISRNQFAEQNKKNPDLAVFTSLDVSDFQGNHSPLDKNRAASDVKLKSIEINSETDSGTENDETCIPEPLSGLFDPSS